MLSCSQGISDKTNVFLFHLDTSRVSTQEIELDSFLKLRKDILRKMSCIPYYVLSTSTIQLYIEGYVLMQKIQTSPNLLCNANLSNTDSFGDGF